MNFFEPIREVKKGFLAAAGNLLNTLSYDIKLSLNTQKNAFLTASINENYYRQKHITDQRLTVLPIVAACGQPVDTGYTAVFPLVNRLANSMPIHIQFNEMEYTSFLKLPELIPQNSW